MLMEVTQLPRHSIIFHRIAATCTPRFLQSPTLQVLAATVDEIESLFGSESSSTVMIRPGPVFVRTSQDVGRLSMFLTADSKGRL